MNINILIKCDDILKSNIYLIIDISLMYGDKLLNANFAYQSLF